MKICTESSHRDALFECIRKGRLPEEWPIIWFDDADADGVRAPPSSPDLQPRTFLSRATQGSTWAGGTLRHSRAATKSPRPTAGSCRISGVAAPVHRNGVATGGAARIRRFVAVRCVRDGAYATSSASSSRLQQSHHSPAICAIRISVDEVAKALGPDGRGEITRERGAAIIARPSSEAQGMLMIYRLPGRVRFVPTCALVQVPR